MLIAQSAQKLPSAYLTMKIKLSTALNQQLFLKLLRIRLMITHSMRLFRMTTFLRRLRSLKRQLPQLKKLLRNLRDALIHALRNTKDWLVVANINANQPAMKTDATAGTLADVSQDLCWIVRADSANLCRV